jgi:hypothetical protein
MGSLNQCCSDNCLADSRISAGYEETFWHEISKSSEKILNPKQSQN